MEAHLFLLLLAIVLAKAGVWGDITVNLPGKIVQSGNYVILLCGSAQPGPPALKLLMILAYIWQHLHNVLVDTHGVRDMRRSVQQR